MIETETAFRASHWPETLWPVSRPKSAPSPAPRPLGPTKRGWKRIKWDLEELAASEPTELARRYDVTLTAVYKARHRLGVEGPDRRRR